MRVVASHNKPVALWSVPRSISTAFERVFVERDDFEVLHEPFSASYYYSEDRLSDRYADEEPRAENNYEERLATKLGCTASWKDECLLGRPAQEDRRGCGEGDA